MKYFYIIISILYLLIVGCNNLNDSTYEDIIKSKDTTSIQLILTGKILYSRTSYNRYDGLSASKIAIIDLKDLSQKNILSYGNGSIYNLTLTHDFNKLAFIKNYIKSYLITVNVDSANVSETIISTSDSSRFINYPCWTNDNTLAGLVRRKISYDLVINDKIIILDRNIYSSKIAISSDGKKVFYASEDDSFHVSLYKYDIDNAVSQIVIKSDTSHKIVKIFDPSISPDGKRIAFTKHFNLEYNDEIWVANIDGTNSHKLITSVGVFGRNPTWSPSGNQIAFVSNEFIYVMNDDGSKMMKLNSTYADEVVWLK